MGSSSPEFGMGFFAGVAVVYLLVIIFAVVCWWRIWSKAGFSGVWALLMFVPFVNIASFIYLAFAEWPVSRDRVDPKTFE
ncbi:hypothetical protein [Ponticaulis sp.]|uniref:hypothetical protein n=1 Tax=Ponticaulis sp. TaxID=2020902 RepID=UPI0025ED24D6|nr:hypothetical protein [Ponticaulis sp.]|tara:strand:- start:14985 stop:15224 length:240 start_codon:yes stop_codon:yes gene_type:complete